MDERKYPADWKEISEEVKKEADYRCEWCGYKPAGTPEDNLATHHLVPNRNLNERWNLIALCNVDNLRAEHHNKEFRKRLALWYENCHEDWLMEELKNYADMLRREGKRV